MLTPKRLLAGLSLTVSLAASAAADTTLPDVSTPQGGRRLQPGSPASVSWVLPARRAETVDEMELLLSLDGGRTFPLRVTGRIDPASAGWLWQVPALPTEHARLALRAGLEERGDSERILWKSDEFAIGSRGGLPLEPIFLVGAEWRTRDALTAPLELPFPSSGTWRRARAEEDVGPKDRGEAVFEKSPRPASAVERLGVVVTASRTVEETPGRLPVLCRSSSFLPRRE